MPLAPLALLSKFAVPLMATAGAVTGGQQAYKQSGGDIGATLLGSGIGALGLGGLPGVGKNLANMPAVKKAAEKIASSGPEAYKASRMFATSGQSSINPAVQSRIGTKILNQAIPVGRNIALGGGLLAGGYLVPRLAGMIGSGASNVVGGIGTAANVIRPKGFDTTTGLPVYGSGAVPDNLATAPGLYEMYDPRGLYQANLGYRQQLGNVELEQMKKEAAFKVPVIDEIKRREMERDLAAAKVRNQLELGRSLTLQGQLGAQALAQQGAADIGAAARQQYRYG